MILGFEACVARCSGGECHDISWGNCKYAGTMLGSPQEGSTWGFNADAQAVNLPRLRIPEGCLGLTGELERYMEEITLRIVSGKS